MTRIAIIGGGAWGTALACIARRAGHEAVLWAREPEVAESINTGAGNPVFLPGAYWWIVGKISYRSEEHTSELQSLMRISYAVFCLKKKNIPNVITLSVDI